MEIKRGRVVIKTWLNRAIRWVSRIREVIEE